MGKKSKKALKARKQKRPKKKCCVTRPRCKRCPLRMLAEGRLPAGYGVKHRRLVKVESAAA
jgi:hypothetical protein